MPAWPEVASVRRFLASASRRRALLAAVEGAGGGLIVSAALALVLSVGGFGRLEILAVVALTAGLSGAIVGALTARGGRRRLAHLVEQKAPTFRNLLITAIELLDRPDRVRPDIGERVCRDTARVASALEVSRLFPARRALTAMAIGAASWVAVLAAAPDARRPASAEAPGENAPAIAQTVNEITELSVTITPPPYSGLEASSVRDPSQLEALQGSRIDLTVTSGADAVALQTIDSEQPLLLTRSEDGRFRGGLEASEDGFIALEPRGVDGAPGALRLVGLAVEPDQAPRVRITAPGQDLFLSEATARLDLAVEASDDVGLASLAMTYTRVVGSGENFEFATGEVPLQISRAGNQSWSATGTLALGALELEPGDMLVYRGVAADRRPGAQPAESDAFIIEILAPGEAAAGGFAIDDQEDRYALSQRMVIIKTERLDARRTTMTADEIAEEALRIAAEQRQVRAEFVFMMGGELTDFVEGGDPFMLHEEEEAHGEADILAGRLANQGRIDLTRAVRSMSLAATALTTPDLTVALVAENEALDALQRAFSRSRYILRTLTERESIDLERRLTGALTETARGALPSNGASADARGEDLRRALADVAELVGEPAINRQQVPVLVALARSVLNIDPASESVRAIAVLLADAARAAESGNAIEARSLIDSATSLLAAEVRAELPVAASDEEGPRSSRLRGAQADAIRQGGGGQ